MTDWTYEEACAMKHLRCLRYVTNEHKFRDECRGQVLGHFVQDGTRGPIYLEVLWEVDRWTGTDFEFDSWTTAMDKAEALSLDWWFPGDLVRFLDMCVPEAGEDWH